KGACLDSTYGVERSFKAMHVGISTFDAPPVTPLGNPLSRGVVGAVEFHFVKQLVDGAKEFRLVAFRKEFLMLLGAVSQKQAATSGDFKGTGRMLVRADSA